VLDDSANPPYQRRIAHRHDDLREVGQVLHELEGERSSSCGNHGVRRVIQQEGALPVGVVHGCLVRLRQIPPSLDNGSAIVRDPTQLHGVRGVRYENRRRHS